MTLAGEMHDSPPLQKAPSRASKQAGQRHVPNLADVRPESFSFRVPSSASLSPLARSASPLSRHPSRSKLCPTPGANETGHHSEWLAEVLRRPRPATGMRKIQIAPHLTESLQTDTAQKKTRHRHRPHDHHHHGKHHQADGEEHEAGGASREDKTCEDKTGELARSKKLLPRSPSSKLRLAAAVVMKQNSFTILRDEPNARAERDRAERDAYEINLRRAERESHEVEKRLTEYHAAHALPSSTVSVAVTSPTAVDRFKVRAYLGLLPEVPALKLSRARSELFARSTPASDGDLPPYTPVVVRWSTGLAVSPQDFRPPSPHARAHARLARSRSGLV